MRNKIKIAFCALFLLGGSIILSAQQPLKFGHINSQSVIESMDEYKAIEVTIKSETDKMEKQLTDMKEEFQKSVVEYQQSAGSLTPNERSLKEQELGERSQKIQNFYSVAQKSLETKAKDLQTPIIAKYTKAVEAVGLEGGFIYIFEVDPGVPVFRSVKSVDVTPLVKAKLLTMAPKPAVTTPAKPIK